MRLKNVFLRYILNIRKLKKGDVMKAGELTGILSTVIFSGVI